jgi:hypothetical protein
VNGQTGIPVQVTDLNQPEYLRGLEAGAQMERAHLIQRLEEYFELVEYSTKVEGANKNEEWDFGFQAAISLLKYKYNRKTKNENVQNLVLAGNAKTL